MNEELKLIDGFFNKGWCCDLDEVYKAVMKLQQENQQLKEELGNYMEIIAKFKDLKSLIGILNDKNLKYSFDEILKGEDNE